MLLNDLKKTVKLTENGLTNYFKRINILRLLFLLHNLGALCSSFSTFITISKITVSYYNLKVTTSVNTFPPSVLSWLFAKYSGLTGSDPSNLNSTGQIDKNRKIRFLKNIWYGKKTFHAKDERLEIKWIAAKEGKKF